MNEKISLEQLKQMSEAERRTYYFSKKGYRVNKPTFKRHLIMRRILRQYHDSGIFKGLTDNKMCKIVDRILELKVQQFAREGVLDIGFGLGRIELKEAIYEVEEFSKGRIKYAKTLDYWAKNPEAYKKAIFIRDCNTKRSLLMVWKPGHTCKKLKYYSFVPQKKLKRHLYHEYLKGNVVILN